MYSGIVGVVFVMSAVFVVVVLSMYVFKIDLIQTILGDLDSFWAERAVWGWTPRRQPRPPDPRKKRRKRNRNEKKPTAKEQADEAREAAIKAARWPYE